TGRAPGDTKPSSGAWLPCAFNFHRSQQSRTPEYQQTGELYPTCESEESEEDTTVQKEERATGLCFPKEKLAHSQKKVAQLIKEKMNTQANRELIRCVILSRIIFGEEHWKCAQALANLAYGYLTLRGPQCGASESRNCLINWLLSLEEKYSSKRIHTSPRHCDGRRASLGIHRLNLALAYFEKAIGNVIAAKGDGTSELIRLYKEIAQIEQLRKNHKQAIQYLKQAYSICVSSFTEISPQTAEVGALLAKAYAMSGDPQHRDAVEVYFIKSINAYQATLGTKNRETLAIIEEFCNWLAQIGKKQEAYRLLKASLKSQVISYGDCSEKVAETLYNMGTICFAKGEVRKANHLLRKCLMIQILIYGNDHSKSRETKNLLTLIQ
uniref:Tetratricopeptide repeat domain 23 like n=1 Tax=Cavia porcellus TaxID=10141 RepID=H0VYI9_CAVPO